MNDLIQNELRSYKGYLKYREELKERIDQIQHELTGLKAIRYDKEPGTFNMEAYEQRRLGLIDRKDILEGELFRVNMNIDYIERFIDTVQEEDKGIVEMLINNETYEKAGERMYLTVSGIQHRLRRFSKHNKSI